MSASTISIIIYFCIVFLHLPRIDGFHSPVRKFPSPLIRAFQPAPTALSSTSLQSFKWPTLPSFATPIKTDKPKSIGERNGLDDEYPWRFEGRFIFRPSLVRTSKDVQPPSSNLLSLFGYSIGGSVVLEYDESPVGPYTEYVTMGGVVGLGKVDVGYAANSEEKTLGLGQWGTNLYVSTQIAEDVCKSVWGVPAQVADIDFVEGGDVLADGSDDDRGDGFTLSGWNNARIPNVDGESKRYGKIPIYWTPTIKALWAPLSFPGRGGEMTSSEEERLLPLHKLRLSASALRLKRCWRIRTRTRTEEGEVPLGLVLVVDNVLIEIGERVAGNL